MTFKKDFPMIEIISLAKTSGSGTKAVYALSSMDMQIAAGMFGLLGPNGAGNTTFMRILAGIVNLCWHTCLIRCRNCFIGGGKPENSGRLIVLPSLGLVR
jgi:ABC-type uncharacterized transport system ATPase subunit